MRTWVLVLIGIVIAAVAVLGVMFLYFRISAPEPLSARSFDLAELGVRLEVSETLADLAYEVRTVERLGPTLRMQAAAVVGEDGKPCELGVFYLIAKDGAHLSGTRWTEESLEAATVSTEGVPPQAKAFADAYLVFEPSQAVCAREPSMIAAEARKRAALWEAVPTAAAI